MTRPTQYSWTAFTVAALATTLAVGLFVVASGQAVAAEGEDLGKRMVKYIEYEQTIQLNDQQEAIKREALEAIPAPCCSDNTAYTCCCPCNMARTIWGLAAHLIHNEGADAKQVKKATEDWIAEINPSGFSGDVCYTRGGCMRPMDQNGCGGMSPSRLAL